jgi:outer membrane lipoprotein carrier protein
MVTKPPQLFGKRLVSGLHAHDKPTSPGPGNRTMPKKGTHPNTPTGGRQASRPAFVWTLATALLALSAAIPAAPSGEERLRTYLSNLATLSAEFRQFTLSADGGRMIESEGTLYLHRPGRFRWEYREPMAQLIVADGKRIWLHDIELDQISHQNQSRALDGTPAQLLASDEPIERYFEILNWDPGDGRDWVELQPRKADGQVTRIRIGFIGDALDTLLMEDSFGQITRFSFLATRRNPKLDEGLFKLDLPPGGDFLEIR